MTCRVPRSLPLYVSLHSSTAPMGGSSPRTTWPRLWPGVRSPVAPPGRRPPLPWASPGRHSVHPRPAAGLSGAGGRGGDRATRRDHGRGRSGPARPGLGLADSGGRRRQRRALCLAERHPAERDRGIAQDLPRAAGVRAMGRPHRVLGLGCPAERPAQLVARILRALRPRPLARTVARTVARNDPSRRSGGCAGAGRHVGTGRPSSTSTGSSSRTAANGGSAPTAT